MNKLVKRVKLLKRILQSQKEGSEYPEAEAVTAYIKKHIIQFCTANSRSKGNYCLLFGADWPKEYNNFKIRGGGVLRDEKVHMHYVMHKGKRMYMRRSMSQENCVGYYKTLLVEQDERSPHRYFQQEVDWKDKVVVDCGAAEGIFALDHIGELGHLYLLEPDEEWIEALRMTFAEYEYKVTIIGHCVGSSVSEKGVSLDYLYKNKVIQSGIDMLKMDIEGSELDALQGGAELLRDSPGCVLYVCEYHDGSHDAQIGQLLKEYTCVRRQGFLFPMPLELAIPADQISAPLIRYGVAEYVKNIEG